MCWLLEVLGGFWHFIKSLDLQYKVPIGLGGCQTLATGTQVSFPHPVNFRQEGIFHNPKPAGFVSISFFFFLNLTISLFIFFNINFFNWRLLYNIVVVLPYIDMNPPRVYMCSPSWTPLPSPSPSPLLLDGCKKIEGKYSFYATIFKMEVSMVFNIIMANQFTSG